MNRRHVGYESFDFRTLKFESSIAPGLCIFVLLELQNVVDYTWLSKCNDVVCLTHCRPTMILYGINNIRDLFGHKVSLSMVKKNPICRLGLA